MNLLISTTWNCRSEEKRGFPWPLAWFSHPGYPIPARLLQWSTETQKTEETEIQLCIGKVVIHSQNMLFKLPTMLSDMNYFRARVHSRIRGFYLGIDNKKKMEMKRNTWDMRLSYQVWWILWPKHFVDSLMQESAIEIWCHRALNIFKLPQTCKKNQIRNGRRRRKIKNKESGFGWLSYTPWQKNK